MFELRMQWLNRLESHQMKRLKSIMIYLKLNNLSIACLSNSQMHKTSVNEIFRDLKAPIRMHRLLQGDVGSGKTVVAAICMYALKQQVSNLL